MSRLKVKISGRVLVKSSASDTPLKRSTFLLTLKVLVIFSCLPFDLADLAALAAGFLGSDDLVFLFLPLVTSATKTKIYWLHFNWSTKIYSYLQNTDAG